MRILFVTNAYPTENAPGDSPCIAQQRRALQNMGHEVDLLHLRGRGSKLKYLLGAWDVFRMAQLRKRYDVVHAHYGYCGIAARFQLRSPVVVTYRGSDVTFRGQRRISKIAAALSDRSIVMTPEMQQLLGGSGTEIVPYGVDLEVFMPRPQADARKTLDLPADTPLILFPYDRRRPEKRYDLVEGALTRLRTEFPDAQVVTISDKPPETVALYMSACDVMVLASDKEGAPVAVREALACDLPVVSVDAGDVSTLISGIENCHLAERNAEDIAGKLARVIRSGNRCEGRNRVNPMSVASSAGRVASIYGELVRLPGESSLQARRPGASPGLEK